MTRVSKSGVAADR